MRTNQISKSEFEARVLELFRQVESSGESVIVTDCGKPVLEVRPYRGVERHALEVLRGTLLRYDNPTTSISEDEWEAA
ncbi:antitoxin (DNA-binding transcriptional repressor) of toxin-antitoxin stability system [Paraburkholderia sp. BL6665CI2N2]|uniref:type II toxin-antitoxin system Phd/YefM family antitoxin n=1 Tax=Paraburkholderia sp. BL6665CI2N2 TaxID=1938806 RepID=UPI0010668BC1|nr:type II toxin-antitoxin system Phd/YefM family antitoxin [Paraburkholderia sp. BL6665CI2N2]TDY23517.1 antitoxin (DNA-binding transcriptional repressor) of toxin-antitoxin stability system [Paraburkholderia sp. BL6665CI2N2]